MPELFASKFKHKDEKNIYVRFPKMAEKASAAFVDHVIVSNHLWYGETDITLSSRRKKCSVILNHVDPAIFYRRSRTRHHEKFIILFPGTFQWHQRLDIAIEAFARLKDKIPNAEFHLYGGGGMEPDLVQLTERLGLSRRVKFCGGLPLDKTAEVAQIETFYFDDTNVRFFPSGDVQVMAQAMLDVIEN
jgi:glycosyltransferase involved in cell wall biosynthesis